MSKYNSKTITSFQNGVHENLLKYIQRYSLTNYQRPARDFSINNIEKIKNWLKDDSFILDLCCGIGESSYQLASRYPERKILGVDKSISRIARKNNFKVENSNILLVQDDMFDLIPLLYKELRSQVIEVHIYYPNPWPKNTHLKRRIHANPVAPFLFALTSSFILRSNWNIYLEEFAFSANYFLDKESKVEKIEVIKNFITPFEKKYALSGQQIYELKIG